MILKYKRLNSRLGEFILVVFLYLFVVINGLNNSENDNNGSKNKIKKFIILMMENRSFDHALGFLKRLNNDIDGCLPEDSRCYNQLDPSDSSSPRFYVNDNAGNVVADPHHSIKETTLQVFGSYAPIAEGLPEKMNGFAQSFQSVLPDSPEQIMECFAPEHLPILSKLAMEYALFDGWHASVPGPTMVRKRFLAFLLYTIHTEIFHIIFSF